MMEIYGRKMEPNIFGLLSGENKGNKYSVVFVSDYFKLRFDNLNSFMLQYFSEAKQSI